MLVDQHCNKSIVWAGTVLTKNDGDLWFNRG